MGRARAVSRSCAQSSGDAEDEVDAASFDAGVAGEVEGPGDVVGIVPAFEGGEVGAVERLGADAQPVDAAVAEDAHEVGRGGLGVALDGEFGVGMAPGPLGPPGNGPEVEEAVHLEEEVGPEVRAKEGGRAAADEDRGEVGGMGGQEAELFDEALDEEGLPVVGVDEAVEVAVVALVEAERDVEIERGTGVVRGAEGPPGRAGLPPDGDVDTVAHANARPGTPDVVSPVDG
jgi:hypothetical protein